MYKLLIVDNIETSTIAINRLVNEEFKEIDVVGTTDSGLEAIRFIDEKQPDILVITISLPEISGLEVVRRVRTSNHHIRIIMDSVYDYFEFASEAIDLEVIAYLLKPIDPKKLNQALKKAILQLDHETKRQSILEEKQINFEKAKELLDYGFIYMILYNANNSNSVVKNYLKILKFPDKGYIMNVELARSIDRIAVLKKSESLLYHNIKETITSFAPCVVGVRMNRRIVVLIGDSKKSAERIIEKLSLMLKQLYHLDVLIGIGNESKIENIHESYEESIQNLRFQKENRQDLRKRASLEYNKYNKYIEIKDQFFSSIKFGKDDCIEIFSKLLEGYRILEEDDRKNKILELLTISNFVAQLEGVTELEVTNIISFYEDMKDLSTEELEGWAYTKIEPIFKLIQIRGGRRKSGAIKEAIHYINENWSYELSLEAVSRYVNLSPQHFSKIFKEETGTSYIEYLTRIRMNEAKKYLLEGRKTIKEICYLVGYHDPNYFSRLFKQMEGITPTLYSKRNV